MRERAAKILRNLVVFFLIADSGWGGEAPLAPRLSPAKESYPPLAADTPIEQVVIKFHEGTHVRLRSGKLVAVERKPRESARLAELGLTGDQIEADLVAVHSLLASSRHAQGLERLFTASEEALAAGRASGEASSGRELADLDLYFRVRVPAGATQVDVETLIGTLTVLASVEIAYAQPPAELPADIPPTTPSFEASQGYLDPAPSGIDARYAWTVPGGRGPGVKIVDVEGGWNTSHEDLPPLFHQGGVQNTAPIWRNHGTAVLGEMVAPANGYGVTGIANLAQAGYESFWAQGVASAIANAATVAGPGGMVLIELHRQGPATPNSPCCPTRNTCDFVPEEYWQDVFDAIAQATANGTIVVEAGGNGSTDLDDPVYGGLFNRSVRDSGAILVGASNALDRAPTCFTNFGSRIDVQAWGENVVTLGYGDLFNGGGDENQFYTDSFMGTSSASPIVTGAAASLQGISLAAGAGSIDPSQMRQLLRATGTPQAPDTRQIGPLPDLRAAIGSLLGGNQPPVCQNDSLTTREGTLLSIFFGTLLVNDSDPDGDNLWVADYDFTTVQGGTNDCCHAGGFNYTPPSGFTGQDQFSYSISDRPDATGLTDTCAVFVNVTPNQPPVARFTFACSGLSCSFDSSTSTDDGLIVARSWSVGGSTFGSGVTASRVFAATGIYTVTLTVTDNGGKQSAISKKVSVTDEIPVAAEGFFTVPPCRIADTRTTTPLTSGVQRTFQVTGPCGIPASAKAVSFNVTVVSPTGPGLLVFGNPTFGPFAHATINFDPANSPRANNASLRLGAGAVNTYPYIAGSLGQVHLILDVYGYFSEDLAPAPGAQGPFGFQTVTPCRIADTRTGPPIAVNTSRNFTVQGVCGVPAGAAAAPLNLAIIGPSAGGHAILYQARAFPPVPMINFNAGVVLANGARIRLAPTTSDVSVNYYSPIAGAATHALIDVYGYFKSDAPLKYRPITPCRAVDTRFADQGGPALGAPDNRSFQIRGNCGVPLSAKAVAVNITTVGSAGPGHLIVYPSGGAAPAASYLNFDPGQGALGNGGIVALSTLPNDLAVASANGTHVIIDVFGYFQ